MGTMDGWSVVLLAAAAYVAVVTLVRLMIRRRNQLANQFRHELAKEKGRREATQRKPPPQKAA
jgi:hypothetical protein